MTLVAFWLGSAPAVWAQYLPCPPPPAPMPEPAPTQPSMQSPSQNGPAYPGPMNGMLAPQGPSGEKLDLPPDVKNAFPPVPQWDDHSGIYAGLGAMGLERQRLGHLPIAVRGPEGQIVPQREEPERRIGPDESEPPPLFLLHTGLPPAAMFGQPPELSLHDITTNYAWGPRFTLGWYDGPQAFEFSGFYLPENTNGVNDVAPSALTSFFFNAPPGFGGLNGLWIQDDQMQASLRTNIGNAEFNYRRWGTMYNQMEILFGVRYFDLQERLDIFTDQADFTMLNGLGQENRTLSASYIVRTHSRLVGPQLGFEGSIPVCQWLELNAIVKGCWGANFTTTHVSLERGDGLTGVDASKNPTMFSHLYEFGLYGDWFIWERGRLHFGYQGIFVLHVPEAQNQVDFNLAPGAQLSQFRANGNIFYHGPVIEFQLLW
jgi:hypothetical protein